MNFDFSKGVRFIGSAPSLAPVISGIAAPGNTITATGSFPSFQWYINGVVVIGQTSNTFSVPYSVVPGDSITASGNGITQSNALTVVDYDSDAANYIFRVETADGQTLEPAVRWAYNTYFIALKQPGTAPIAAHAWEAMTAGTALLMIGARTLAGALVTMHPSMPAPMNYNFVSGDYNRKTGLKGDAATKYLNLNILATRSPQNDSHESVHITEINNIGSISALYIGRGRNSNDRGIQIAVWRPNSSPQSVTPSPGTGFRGWSRADGSQYSHRHGGASSTSARNSGAVPGTGNVLSFKSDSLEFTDGRMDALSDGRAVDLAALDAAQTALIAAINAAIP